MQLSLPLDLSSECPLLKLGLQHIERKGALFKPNKDELRRKI